MTVAAHSLGRVLLALIGAGKPKSFQKGLPGAFRAGIELLELVITLALAWIARGSARPRIGTPSQSGPAGTVAIFEAGSGGFILQRLHDEAWARMTMMQLMVDDLDAWWMQNRDLGLPGKFGVLPPKPPAIQPWGLRVAYIVDPAVVLWHIAQWRPGVRHDA